MPYNPTWNNPYVAQYAPPVQPPLHTQGVQRVMADGHVEANNRLLMMYQPSQLIPGFTSDAVWDVNGRQFYALSVESDGRRNFETFDYSKHVDEHPVQIDGAQFVSKQEYDTFVAKVSAALEALNGVRRPVQTQPSPTVSTATAPAGTAFATEVDGGLNQGDGGR